MISVSISCSHLDRNVSIQSLAFHLLYFFSTITADLLSFSCNLHLDFTLFFFLLGFVLLQKFINSLFPFIMSFLDLSLAFLSLSLSFLSLSRSRFCLLDLLCELLLQDDLMQVLFSNHH
ncbi:hypothetical protein EDC96DRAFT_524101 [Choanephora cucurbitarum]|nr:hypothetical protein EDC96DRAFT_524101 [Choanephora cucurbitarum]